MKGPRTLYQKHIDAHTVCTLDDHGHVLLYIDRQVANEYTSPQAFSGLREANRTVWRPSSTLCVVDHVNPTAPDRVAAMPDAGGALQVSYFEQNCRDFGIELFDVLDKRQGIEHVVAPEQGFILPGMVVAAGDSHTTTYGALGAFGFGIGTSEIEHLLATQTLVYKRLKTLRVNVHGRMGAGVTSKDIIMALIRDIGASGATGYAIEFSGPTIESLSVEARMTICNMAVEAGARGAFMAPDEKVYAYLKDKPRAPKGALWEQAVEKWKTLYSDPGAHFDKEVELDASALEPMVTWGTSPDQAAPIGECVPDPRLESDLIRRQDLQRALRYMGLEPGTRLAGVPISHAFIGSCTNARIEDLRDVARIVRGRKVAASVRAMIVPGSTRVRDQAQAEGLAQIFKDAGFEWRQSGCSMCLAMNDDVLSPGDRCASSTNRNFEGRQGAGARTHLMSPAMVAAAAICGHLTDVRQLSMES
ncbi:3-isopropylmalate dehydratase large subunit [Pseudomonas sp. Fig-3]|jgi:3-isopropylmalate/(R)-2-methylmalate dehydratase large subunit|uniref:3-isopropylmalate dehydratase large subunit n=1 Tax=Pseudomonas TaxID=286 RepID=UPI0006408F51|nr:MULTISPECIES: 3-isopropylmalate dehydratase large subunit [Pseudomonas]MDD2030581.1 3-isopropylmalate dehydratase large subunit [Pseudomonas sp. 39167]MEA1027502.1 3-isopropylmalate dehydratase large subunit [Pseudomonas sp. N-137]MXR29918.1 3-isopropylmalate dehydratase large subunit [Pseudomonas sp. PICF6]TNB83038.1 3-isopropylmalate dehydratase large subunit [Pseudomonas sp. Fig-3]VII91015.1 3-isopropylmalate dehydratase large subunit (EC 4.2.1.33) [Pseudomonas sp. FG-3G]